MTGHFVAKFDKQIAATDGPTGAEISSRVRLYENSGMLDIEQDGELIELSVDQARELRRALLDAIVG